MRINEQLNDRVGNAQPIPRNYLILIVLFAFALRVAVMIGRSSYHFVDYGDDHFDFGWEMGRVARSLSEGHGFSSPMPLPTGPTAIVGPLYPLLLALLFKMFGVYSTASAAIILTLQCLFSGITCLFIYLCGRDTLGEATGKLAAFVWALFPLNIFFTVTRIWDTSITPMLAVALFWYMLPLRYSAPMSRWAVSGILLGIAALINTSLVVLGVPFVLSAIWRNRMGVYRHLAVLAMTFIAVVSPWLIRNYLEFGKAMLRSNFPLEFRIGNNEESRGQKIDGLHPTKSVAMNEHWNDVGENQFMSEERDLNSQFLSKHFSLFALSSLNRMVNYWTGAWIAPTVEGSNSWSTIVGTSIVTLLGLLGIYRMFSGGNAAAFMYAGCLLLYPLLYYVTTSQPRFYHAITPLLILPGAFLMVSWKTQVSAKR